MIEKFQPETSYLTPMEAPSSFAGQKTHLVVARNVILFQKGGIVDLHQAKTYRD